MARVRLDVDTKSDTAGLLAAAKGTDKLADAMDRTSEEARELDRRLESTGRKVKELAREIARAGDQVRRTDLEKAFGDEKRTLAKLRAVRRELDEVGDEAQEAERKIAQVGKGAAAGAGVFGGLFGKAVGSPLTLALIGGAAAASPLIAGAVGAAVVAGIGSAGVAAGLAGAFQDARVKASAADLGREIKNDMIAAGSAFEEPALTALAKVRKVWRTELRGEISGAIGDSAKLLDPLLDAGLGFVKAILPGIRHAIREAGPIFDVLENDLPKLGTAISEVFDMMASRSDKTAAALSDVLTVTREILLTTGQMLGFLVDAYDVWRKFVSTGHFIADVFQRNTIAGDGQVVIFKRIHEEGGAAFSEIAGAARDARIEAEQLNAEFQTAFEKIVNLDQASVDFKLGNIELRKELKEIRDEFGKGAKTLDERTAAGLRNRDAILRQIESAAQLRQAEIDAAGGTEEAVRKANAAYLQKINQIRAVGAAAGLSKQDLDAFLAKYLELGRAPNITKKVTFVSDTSKFHPPKVAPGTYTAFAKGGITAAQHGLITDKPTVLFGERGTGKEGFLPQLGISRHRAAGLLSEMASWHDMAVMPKPARGSSYMSLPPTGRSGSASSAPIPVEIHVHVGDEVVRVVRTEITEHDRALKRRVTSGVTR